MSASTRSHFSVATPPGGVAILPATDPRRRFPVHLGFLARAMEAEGADIRTWTILHAEETRLDDDGMEVEFVLLRRFPHHEVRTRRVVVDRGRLVAISERERGAAARIGK